MTVTVTVAVAVATIADGFRYFTVDIQDGCRYTTHNGRNVATGVQPVGDSGRVSVWDRNRDRGGGSDRHRINILRARRPHHSRRRCTIPKDGYGYGHGYGYGYGSGYSHGIGNGHGS